MTVRTPSAIKAFFEKDDQPTETQFSDLIDTTTYGVVDIVRDHGADPSGATDSTAAIQAALEASASGIRNVYIPSGTFVVSPQTHTGITGINGNNSVCAFVSANTRIFGVGTLQLASGAAPASGAILGCKNVNARANITIEGITIDGNKANTTGSCSGIKLIHASNAKILNNEVYGVTGVGITIKADTINESTIQNFNNLIAGNYVHSIQVTANSLGIQTDYTEGTRIVYNRVSGASGNGIGVFGDDASGPVGQGNIVANNTIKDVLSGIFFESDGESVISGNYIEGMAASAAGIYLNTSNSFALKTTITGNIIRATNSTARSGIFFRLATDNNIYGNHIEGCQWGIYAKDGSSRNYVGTNFFERITDYLVYAERGTNEMARFLVEKQVYTSAQDSDRWPKEYFDTAEPEASARYSNVTFADPGWSLEGNAALSNAFYYGTSFTDENAAWSSAHSIFNAGETLVKVSAVGGVLATASNRIRLNGEYFIVHSRAGAVLTVRNTASTAGDFTAVTNVSASVFAYTSAQFTRMVTE